MYSTSSKENYPCDVTDRRLPWNAVESRFLEPPGETQIGSRNREFEKSKVASNYA